MNVFNKLVTPNWLLDSGIIQCFRNIKQAFSELEVCERMYHASFQLKQMCRAICWK